MDPTIRRAIKVFSLLLMQLSRAFSANAKLYFMSSRNPNDRDLPEQERSEADFLDLLLFESQAWRPAVQLIEDHPQFEKKLRLRDFISTNLELRNIENDERYPKLMHHVQLSLVPYWSGWKVGDMDPGKFLSLYDEAVRRASGQQVLLNSLWLTISRAISRQSREQKATKSIPTTFIVITGSELQEGETEELKQGLQKVQAGAQGFAIQTVAVTRGLKDRSVRAHDALDNFNSGQRDIYDVTQLAADEFLTKGVTEVFWEKVLNSHESRHDSKRLTPKSMFGATPLFPQNAIPSYTVPSVPEIKTVIARNTD